MSTTGTVPLPGVTAPLTTTNHLAAKLAQVMLAIDRIPKDGFNDFHGYSYALEASIVEAVRKELASRGVVIIPSIISTDLRPVGEKGAVLTTLTLQFTIIDSESGEQIVSQWLGSGEDKNDKGVYKAITGALKYFLLKTFMLPTWDDPEKDGHEKARKRTTFEPPPKDAPRETVNTRTGEVTTDALAGDGLTITKIYPASGKKPCGVVFSDGTKGTTFDPKLEGLAVAFQREHVRVIPEYETKGKWTNLVNLKRVEVDVLTSEIPPPSDDDDMPSADLIPF